MADIAGPYSSLKILHHPERIAALKRGEQIVPTQLQIILSDLCNHSCGFCSYRWDGYSSNELFSIGPLAKFGHNNPIRMMPTEKAIEIIDDCAEMGVYATQFSVWGEERIPIVTQGKRLATVKIGDFVDGLFNREPSGYEEMDVSEFGIKTFAIDDDGTLILDNLTKVYRHRATEPIWEVVLHDGRTARVTASHSLNAFVDGSIVKKPVSELKVGDLIACATWHGDFEETIDSERRFAILDSKAEHASKDVHSEVPESSELYRLLGYYTAEGSSVSRSLLWIFGNGPREDFYREDTLRCIESVFGAKGVICREGRAIAIHSVKAQTFVLGAVGGGGVQRDRQIPWIVWQASREHKLEYLRGLFSGDGNFRSSKDSRGYNRNSLHIKTCNQSLMEEVAMLIRQLGARCTVSKGRAGWRQIEGRSLSPTDNFCVNVYDSRSLEILKPVLDGLMAEPSYADSVHSKPGRPHSTIREFGDAVLLPIKSIRQADELGLPIVYDVTVEKTHRFLLSNGIGCANTGGGEITVHPDHVKIMRHALDKGLDCALVSNGEICRDGHIENLLRFKWVRFSLDAASPDTYASIRSIPAERMERVLSNIRKLVQARRRYKSEGNPCDLIVGIGFVVTKENWREVFNCAALAKSLGVDNIRLSAVFQPDNDAYFADFHEEAAELCKRAELLSGDGFRVFNNFGERYQDLVEKHPDYSFCGYQQLVSYVGADLNLYRCCVTSYSNRGLIGSLKNQRFKELWESEQKRKDFDEFDARGCPLCMFNQKNRTILYAIDKNPKHANFV